jgi:hypothetical protein
MTGVFVCADSTKNRTLGAARDVDFPITRGPSKRRGDVLSEAPTNKRFAHMKVDQFLSHHGLARNPFTEEDASTDQVFKGLYQGGTHHPAWDKVFGDPRDPSTAIVFGEKGAGKTAMRLQLAKEFDSFNRQNPKERVFVVHYDDFNPFLDRFRDRLSLRSQRADRALGQWKLWDHMDAILSLAVTNVIDQIVSPKVVRPESAYSSVTSETAKELGRHQARDLLLLAAAYDFSKDETFIGRWHKLRRTLGYHNWQVHLDWYGGIAWTVLWLIFLGLMFYYGYWANLQPLWLFLLLTGAGWLPWLWRAGRRYWTAIKTVRHLRVGNRKIGELWPALMAFPKMELIGQPLPNHDRTDDRYELLHKFMGLLESLKFTGMVVLVDRVDEPHVINGSPELMKLLVWPMLDNKFLKQPRIGFKMMLPIELRRFIEKEQADFYQRARLDKQNVINDFQWTGEALYDLAATRIKGCAAPEAQPTVDSLFAPEINRGRLLGAFKQLRVPRHLFKFFYRLFVQHCNAHTDEAPSYKISSDTFETTLALYLRDQDAFDRGVGAG